MPILRVENLGKCYQVARQSRSNTATLRDAIVETARLIVQRKPKLRSEDFWALNEVSFTIEQGERVGIIGRNGAGKSTLLKILSRITEPTRGRIEGWGRVASLLEVGTGFHPELTGRENIYLNGAILGMSRSEIARKFDEIVDFAEVERFLDTPVKRYSSGMYVRLAFAVAAHLEPEILIVDEVLAVGDVQFQKKCLNKMEDVGKAGRTVLFVSHNLSTVEALCTRGIVLQQGALRFDGTAHEAVQYYLDAAYELANSTALHLRRDRSGNGKVRASHFRILDLNETEVNVMQSGGDYFFEIGYHSTIDHALHDVAISLDVFDDRANRLLLFRSNFTNENVSLSPSGGAIRCCVRDLPLANGSYRFSVFLSHANAEVLDYITDVAPSIVEGGDFFGTGSGGLPTHCKILKRAEWSTI
ncbi:MAG: ABC transporter ATP-binding protein [Plectolyngbya sp. WJT66-NPBG17]|jgi:lipopolysaccharide transport system ATP-binding protein|nr:ABC transporter ATP-binding protein [Plectolyngbya sp. WJT66-NPBG17]